MDKIALVTGLNGFVGQHLKQALEKKKITVIGIPHDMFYTYEEALPRLIEQYPPDYIFHLASYGNMIDHQDDDGIIAANLYGTYKLLQATRHINYRAFINISTSSVLLSYQTLYSATKFGAEKLAEAIANKYEKPIVSVRPFSLYGEGEQETHLIPRIFRSCLFGEPLRLAPDPKHDWVYVKDFVQALIAIAISSDLPSEPVQVGTGHAISNGSVLNYIERITGRAANLVDEIAPREYDTQDWFAHPKNGYVFYSLTSLKDGLQKVYESYKL